MDYHARVKRLLPSLALLAAQAGCTDSNLYGQLGQEPKLADKLTLEGVLCTDNPAFRRFPVKILFIVDSSGTMRETAPLGQHIDAIEGVVNNFLPIANVELGVIRYDSRPESLIQVPLDIGSSGFTRDDALVDAALTLLRNGAGARNFADALSLARSIVTGDAFQADTGPLSRTKYVLVHVTSGSPNPPIRPDRCDDLFDVAPGNCEVAFLDRVLRDMRDEVLELGAAEFNFHTVFVEPPQVEGAVCDPTIGGTNCAPGLACVQTGGRPDSGRCVEACDPAAPACTNPTDVCATTTLISGTTLNHCARGELSCFDGFDNDGDGQDLDCSDPTYPYNCSGQGGCEPDCRSQCRMEEIGIEMSLATGGRYERFAHADQINLSRIDFRSTQERFLLKEFIAVNRNSLPTENGLVPDSDADGLSDAEERELGLDALFADTDGDSFNDRLEYQFQTLGFDPLTPDFVPTCDNPELDVDGDGLRDCEEDLLATDPTLFDTDADGFPDWLEFRMGTNAIFRDSLDDIDIDGAPNGVELRANTDPLSNDARVRASLAYRYRIVDLGPTSDQRQCYNLRISNITLVDTLDQGFGPGFNDIEIYFGQVPQSNLEGFGLYKVALIRVQFLPPETRNPDAPSLDLAEDDFIFVEP
jgi:hypothetical protein